MILNETTFKYYCDKYNFRYKLVGNHVQINSKRDIWYVPNNQFYVGKTHIKLLHNNIKGKGGWHFQSWFSSYDKLFYYILQHDNKISYSFNKMFRIDKILKQLQEV